MRECSLLPRKPEDCFQMLFLVALLAANGLAFIPATLDESWGALYIGVVVNPCMNGLFALGGCVSLIWLKRTLWAYFVYVDRKGGAR
jgi:hypothetical protein